MTWSSIPTAWPGIRDFGEQFLGRVDPKTGKVTRVSHSRAQDGLSDRHPRSAARQGRQPVGRFDVPGRRSRSSTARARQFQVYPDAEANGRDRHRSRSMVSPQIRTWTARSGRRTTDSHAIHRLDLATGQIRESREFQGLPSANRTISAYGIPCRLTKTISICWTSAPTISAGSTPRPRSSRSIAIRTPNSRPRRGQVGCAEPPLVRRIWRQRHRHVRPQDREDPGMGSCRRRGAQPYDVVPDKNGEVWTGSMLRRSRDRGSIPRPASSPNICCRRRPTSAACSSTTRPRPVTFWVGSNHGASILKARTAGLAVGASDRSAKIKRPDLS